MDSTAITIATITIIVSVHLAAFLWWERRRRRMLARAKAVGDRLLGRAPAETDAMVQKPRTMLDAMHEWLLPHSYHPVDYNEARTFIRLDIHVRLGWDDRLRLLLCGDMRVLSTVYTDVEVKQCRALTNIEVHPFTVSE